MLKTILNNLVGELETTNYFEKIFPLVELVDRGEKVSPEEYAGKGQYNKVNNFDSYKGVAYFRELSSGQVLKIEPEENQVPCKTQLQFDYTIRLVACVKRELLEKDNAFSDEMLSQRIIKLLTKENGTINPTIKANYTSVIPYSVIKDRKEILGQEYPGTDVKMNLAFSYVAIDFHATVQIYQSCLTDLCGEDY